MYPLLFCLFVSSLLLLKVSRDCRQRAGSCASLVVFLVHHTHARHEVIVGSFIDVHGLHTPVEFWHVNDDATAW